MTTWRIGDSWVTLNGLTIGSGGGKMASREDAYQRKAAQTSPHQAQGAGKRRGKAVRK